MVAIESTLEHFDKRLSKMKVMLTAEQVAEATGLLETGKSTLFEAQVLQSFSKVTDPVALRAVMGQHNEAAASRGINVLKLVPALWARVQSHVT